MITTTTTKTTQNYQVLKMRFQFHEKPRQFPLSDNVGMSAEYAETAPHSTVNCQSNATMSSICLMPTHPHMFEPRKSIRWNIPPYGCRRDLRAVTRGASRKLARELTGFLTQ